MNSASDSVIVGLPSNEISEYSLSTGALLRRVVLEGSSEPCAITTCPVPRGPLTDSVFVLSSDWSLTALVRDRTDAWDRRCLMGPNLKRAKEKPLDQCHASVSTKSPLLFFSMYGHRTVRAYSLSRALPPELRDQFESEREHKAGGMAPLQLKTDHKAAIAGLTCHPSASVLFVLFTDGLVRAYDTESARKGSLTPLASFNFGCLAEAGKKAPTFTLPYLANPIAAVQLPGQERALLASVGAGKVVVAEVQAASGSGRCNGHLIASGALPTSDYRSLGVHIDTSHPNAPTVMVPMRRITDPSLEIFYAHAHTSSGLQGALAWKIASVQGGHIDRGEIATSYASSRGVLVTYARGGAGSSPGFFRVFPRGSLLSGSTQKIVAPFQLPADIQSAVTRAASGGKASVPVPTTFTWVEGGVLTSYSWSEGNRQRLFQLPGTETRRVLEVHHSHKTSSWLVFFESLVPSGNVEADRTWTLVHASTVGHSVPGSQWLPGVSEGRPVGPPPLGALETTPWVAPGFTGCFLGADEENFAILAKDRFSLLLFDTTTTTSEMPPIMTVRFLSPCAAVFPGPCTRAECTVWVDEAAGTVSLSQDLMNREPNLLGVATGTPSVEADRTLQLTRGEAVLDVVWQTVPTGRGVSTSLAAILTTERVLVVGPGLELLAEHRADDQLRTGGRPFVSVLWLGPSVLVLDSAMQVSAVASDGTVLKICQLPKTQSLHPAVLAGALTDRIVAISEFRGGSDGPCAPALQLSTRTVNLVPALMVGWSALSLNAILPGGPPMLKDRLRPLLAAWDVVRAAPPLVLAGAIRKLAQAGLKPLAAQLCERGRETLGDLANSCYLAAGLWGPATRAAVEVPGRWFPLAREATAQGEFSMGQRCYVHGGDPVEALLLSHWGGDLEGVKAMGTKKRPEDEWVIQGVERPRTNPSLEGLVPHVARELAGAVQPTVLSTPPLNRLEELSQLANRGGDASSSGPALYLPSLGAAPELLTYPHGLLIFGEDSTLPVPAKAQQQEAGMLGLPELDPGAEDLPWVARPMPQGMMSRGNSFRVGRLLGSSNTELSRPSAQGGKPESHEREASASNAGAGAGGFGVDGVVARGAGDSDSSGDDGFVVPAPATKRINIVIRPREETAGAIGVGAGPSSEPSLSGRTGPLTPPAPQPLGGGDLKVAVAGIKLTLGGPPAGGKFQFKTQRADSESSQTSDRESTISGPSTVGGGHNSARQPQPAVQLSSAGGTGRLPMPASGGFY